MLETVVIYHMVDEGKPCPDGLSSAWVCNKYWSKRSCVTFIGHYYGKKPPNFTREKYKSLNIIIVDCYLSPKLVERWIEQGHKVTLLDHHQTTYDNFLVTGNSLIERMLKVDLNLEECAATLTWKHYFKDEKIPLFLEYIKDKDIFQDKLKYTTIVDYSYQILKHHFTTYDYYYSLGDNFLSIAHDIGKIILTKQNKQIEGYFNKTYKVSLKSHSNIPGVKIPPSCVHLIGDAARKLFSMYPYSPFVIVLRELKRELKCSLRANPSIPETNVEIIAKIYGGGGQKHASGFSIHYNNLPRIQEIVHD